MMLYFDVGALIVGLSQIILLNLKKKRQLKIEIKIKFLIS